MHTNPHQHEWSRDVTCHSVPIRNSSIIPYQSMSPRITPHQSELISINPRNAHHSVRSISFHISSYQTVPTHVNPSQHTSICIAALIATPSALLRSTRIHTETLRALRDFHDTLFCLVPLQGHPAPPALTGTAERSGHSRTPRGTLKHRNSIRVTSCCT